MSTRKIIRNGMRRTAELRGYRPSAYVRSMFEALQINNFGGGSKGRRTRLAHQAIGTSPRRTWKNRIQAVLED